MKCIYCEKEAKWKSAIYPSPVCDACGRIEVNKLLATGKYSSDETAIIDYYIPINIDEKDIVKTVETGETN